MTPELSPQHEAVLEAVLRDLPDAQAVSQVALGRVRGELKKRLAPYATGLAEDQEVHVDRMSLRAALVCPASAERDPFQWTAPTAARTVGLPAVSSLVRGADDGPLGAVQRSIDEAVEEGRSIGQWLTDLDPVGRATVAAAAATWCARAMVAVPWSSFERVSWFNFQSVYAPSPFGFPISVRGRPDAAVELRRGRVTERVLLTLGPFDAAVAGLDALTVACKTGRTPLRTVFVHPSAGRVEAADIDVAMLDAALEDVEHAVAALMPLAIGQAADEVPGRQCWSCDRNDRCATGGPWMAAQPPRIDGIPIG